jgi:hypothetical protein
LNLKTLKKKNIWRTTPSSYATAPTMLPQPPKKKKKPEKKPNKNQNKKRSVDFDLSSHQ